MTLNTADQRAVDKRNKGLKRQSLVADESVKWIMSDLRGRAYLAELLRESQALLPIVAGSNDGAMFREGRKVLGHKIMADVQRCLPKQFPGLIQAVFEEPKDEKNDERNEPDLDE